MRACEKWKWWRQYLWFIANGIFRVGFSSFFPFFLFIWFAVRFCVNSQKMAINAMASFIHFQNVCCSLFRLHWALLTANKVNSTFSRLDGSILLLLHLQLLAVPVTYKFFYRQCGQGIIIPSLSLSFSRCPPLSVSRGSDCSFIIFLEENKRRFLAICYCIETEFKLVFLLFGFRLANDSGWQIKKIFNRPKQFQ